jgi:hypothetical protein
VEIPITIQLQVAETQAKALLRELKNSWVKSLACPQRASLHHFQNLKSKGMYK